MGEAVVQDRRFKSDTIFNQINKQFITLKDDAMQEYNVHLKAVLDAFIEPMRKDPLFNACYRRIAYVGSYYEGLKVEKPEEFDLNIIINLPINYSNSLEIKIASERPGYIKIKANATVLPNLRKHPRWNEYSQHSSLIYSGGSTGQPDSEVKGTYRYYCPRKNSPNNDEVESNLKQTSNKNPLKSARRAASQRRRRYRKKTVDSWFDKDGYIDQNKFRQWFESVTSKALNSLESYNGKHVLVANGKKYLIGHKKSGPAWTLKIDVPGGHTVDVDLVPVLEFTTPPPTPFRRSKSEKQNWFAISKPVDGPSNNILWRPSFYEWESVILKGSIKPVIRQMKKLRDTQNFKSIASYYIKTLFLRELDDKTHDFDKLSATNSFFYMLKKLQEASANGQIYDFWNPKNNLLGGISPVEMSNISCRLNNIIKDIDKRIVDDPYVVAEYILTKNELEQLKMSRLNASMASTSIGSNNVHPQPAEEQNNTIISGIWNYFWGPATPAMQ